MTSACIIGLPDAEAGESVTLSGVLQAELGRVPVSGDEISWRGWRVRVLTASPTRARLVRLYPPDGAVGGRRHATPGHRRVDLDRGSLTRRRGDRGARGEGRAVPLAA